MSNTATPKRRRCEMALLSLLSGIFAWAIIVRMVVWSYSNTGDPPKWMISSCGLAFLCAIILGIIALVEIGKSKGGLAGRWQAITGIILCALPLILPVIAVPVICVVLMTETDAEKRGTAQEMTYKNGTEAVEKAADSFLELLLSSKFVEAHDSAGVGLRTNVNQAAFQAGVNALSLQKIEWTGRIQNKGCNDSGRIQYAERHFRSKSRDKWGSIRFTMRQQDGVWRVDEIKFTVFRTGQNYSSVHHLP